MHTQLYYYCVCIKKKLLTSFDSIVPIALYNTTVQELFKFSSSRPFGPHDLNSNYRKNRMIRHKQKKISIQTLQLNISGSLAHSKFIIKIHMIKTLDKIKSFEDGDLISHDSSSGSLFCSSKVNGRIQHFLVLPSPTN